MATPLTKTDTETEKPYVRPASIEGKIDEAVTLDLATLKERLSETDRTSPTYLPSECLVHLIRLGRRRSNSGNDPVMNAAFPVLLTRCERVLLAKVVDGAFNDAAELRDDILGQFAELFATDGTGDNPNELDFFECRFNLAFRTFYIDLMRKERRHENRFATLPADEDGESDDYEEVFARVSKEFQIAADQDGAPLRTKLSDAILSLPDKERDAVILVYVMGYPEEAVPGVVSAATKCNCTGRTIRNRLKSAAVKLARFKEEL